MKGIFWIASYPKSGNTWFRVFIENLFRNTPAPANINDLQITRHGDALPALYAQIAGRPPAESITGLTDEELHRFRQPLHRALANGPETSFVKTHNMLALHNDIPLINLEYTAGAVYILRNPFDLVVSLAEHFRLSIDDAIEAIAAPSHRTLTTEKAIFQILGTWSDHYRSWFAVENFTPLLLRYEDMIRHPARSFGKVAKALNLPRDPDRLKRAIRNSSFAELARQEQSGGFREQVHADHRFFRSGKIGGWRDVLTDQQVGRIVEDHRDLLVEQRYISKDGTPRI